MPETKVLAKRDLTQCPCELLTGTVGPRMGFAVECSARSIKQITRSKTWNKIKTITIRV